jgi:RNA polymerase subunit RPABC4/transcription elongation factor Spt4
MEEEKIDPGHSSIQRTLRIGGPILLAIGLIFISIGTLGFFISILSQMFSGVWLIIFILLGIPLLFLGSVMTMFGYIGRLARYQAGEIAPVGKDTINYMVDGTKESLDTISHSLGKGLGEGIGAALSPSGKEKSQNKCHKCGEPLDADANFCDNCGSAVTREKSCPRCHRANDPDARFCDNCGYQF